MLSVHVYAIFIPFLIYIYTGIALINDKKDKVLITNCTISSGCVIGVCMGEKKTSSDFQASKDFFDNINKRRLYLLDCNGITEQIWPPTRRTMIFDNLNVFGLSPLAFDKKDIYSSFEIYYFKNSTKINVVLHNICFHFYKFDCIQDYHEYRLKNYFLGKNDIMKLIIIYDEESIDQDISNKKDILIYCDELGKFLYFF